MATQSSSAHLELLTCNGLPPRTILGRLKVRYRDDPFMASRVNSAWLKLDKYYTKPMNSAPNSSSCSGPLHEMGVYNLNLAARMDPRC